MAQMSTIVLALVSEIQTFTDVHHKIKFPMVKLFIRKHLSNVFF